MLINENGRPDVAASERPAVNRSISPSHENPQTQYTTGVVPQQDKNKWDYDDETRLVDYIIGPFICPKYRKLTVYQRDLKYNAAMREINRYGLSSEANLYARKTLADSLRL